MYKRQLLKQKHRGLKRNVKFDDGVMDLVMDIKLDANSPWQKMRPDQAQEAQKGRAEPSREAARELDSSAISSLMDRPPAPEGPATGGNSTPMGE